MPPGKLLRRQLSPAAPSIAKAAAAGSDPPTGAHGEQHGDQGEAEGRPVPGRRDPLGRQLGQGGEVGTDQSLAEGEGVGRRAEELLAEIRRRAAEQERPKVELDYLKRLLDRF